MKPLNGEKTHPLTTTALMSLRELENGPMPRQVLNPGVANRLEREALVEVYNGVSPYPSAKGKSIQFLRITDAGRRALSATSEGN